MTAFSDLTGTLLDHELGTADSTQLFTTGRRERAVNDGIAEFAELTECLIRQSTLTMTSGTGEYNLTSTTVIADGDFVRVAAQGPEYHFTDSSSNVTYLAGRDWPRRDVEWLNSYVSGWRSSTGTTLPDCWYLREDGGALYLGFYPKPAFTSSESAKVLFPYVARPSSLSASTSEPYTVSAVVRTDLRPFHQGLVHFAASQLEKLRPDSQASDRQLTKFLAYVTRFLQARRPKGGQHITVAKTYFRDTRRQADRERLFPFGDVRR